MPDRVASLTVLNTPVEVDRFRRPWVMEPLAHRGIGEIYLRVLNKPLFRRLMRWQGIDDKTKISNAELDAYLDLLRRGDGGRALLKIMRGFERTPAKRQKYVSVLRSDRYPVQIIWGEADPALKINVDGERARAAAGLDQIHRLPAKHFLQEDQAPALADLITKLVRT
jgi:haloalkane dehalogenase